MSRPDKAAHVIGNWRLLDLLGAGRWSRVYRARPRERAADFPSDYAVKLVRDDLREGADGVARLQREALVAQAVAHPNLICILAARLRRPPYCLVMPCLNGETVRWALATVPRMALPHALWIARQAAEALLALHQAGWIHSDLKPSNVLVAPEGHVTVLDLGLARRVADAECRADRLLAGTPAYAAPESFEPLAELTPAADIYSLGITLYEMLTGRRPFTADAPAALITAHQQAVVPDPREFVPELPERVVRLLRRMLEKAAHRRPQTAAVIEWLSDLERDTAPVRLAA